MRSVSATRKLALALEDGSFCDPAARGASRLWSRIANPTRELALPARARVVGIGGATLGGSGKSVVVCELARALRETGLRVAVVASNYRARLDAAVRVSLRDSARRVGDDALASCRSLNELGVPVFVGPSRAAAIALADSSGAELVLADGLLQSRPERVALSILALEARAPWGAGHCPPAGDLRARRELLLDAADVVLVHEPESGPESRFHGFANTESLAVGSARPVLSWSSVLTGARTAEGVFVTLAELRRLTLGLVLAVARSERIESELESHGVCPSVVRLCADHATPGPGLRLRLGLCAAGSIDAWLTTPKCATKLGREFASAPLWVLERRVSLPSSLMEICGALVRRRRVSSPGFLEAAP